MFQPDIRLSTFGYQTLAVEVGFPKGFEPEDPSISLHSPSMDAATRVIALPLIPAARQSSVALDKAKCRNIDWVTYAVDYNDDEWSDFWANTGSERFTVGYEFSDRSVKADAHSFAIAILNKETSEPIVACGCYGL